MELQLLFLLLISSFLFSFSSCFFLLSYFLFLFSYFSSVICHFLFSNSYYLFPISYFLYHIKEEYFLFSYIISFFSDCFSCFLLLISYIFSFLLSLHECCGFVHKGGRERAGDIAHHWHHIRTALLLFFLHRLAFIKYSRAVLILAQRNMF